MLKKIRTWTGTIAWMSLIFASSCTLVTVPQLTKVVTSTHVVHAGEFQQFWSHWWWVFVKGWHMTEFGILAALVWRRSGRIATALWVPILFAATDEWHQTFVPGRGGRLTDVLIDAAGVVLVCGWVVCWSRNRTLQAYMRPAFSRLRPTRDLHDSRTIA